MCHGKGALGTVPQALALGSVEAFSHISSGLPCCLMCLSNNAKRPCSSAIISVRMEVMSVSQVSLCQALGQLAAAGGGHWRAFD